MDMTDEFLTPPAHVNFKAKRLFGHAGTVTDGAIAYIEKGGGGPTTPHSHPHDHLFIVVKGAIRVEYADGERVTAKENEAITVTGLRSHSVWNAGDDRATVIGLTVGQE